MKLLTFHGIIRKVETLSHGSLRIRIDTQEKFPPDSASLVFSLKDLFGAWGVKVEDNPDVIPELLPSEIPDYVPEFKDEKSPSERLRNVMFVYWKQKKIVEPFEMWRLNQMEEIITKWKSELEPV